MNAKPPGQRQETTAALCFLLPNLIGFLLFTAWPVVASLGLSFTSWDLLTPPRWVGLDNYVELLGFHQSAEGLRANDPNFWKYLGNTLFLMLVIPVNMAGSLALALALNRKIRFSHFYRVIFFLPSILAGVAIFYLWRWMYNPDFGLINAALAGLGIEGPRWLVDPFWAKPALMMMSVWLGVGGGSMILDLAALQGVPQELYEAAEIDGAGAWRKFWVVTWPSVMPVTFFIFTMALIGGFQSGFDMAYIMTGGGPFGSTTTIGYYIYTKAYVFFEMGYASAVAYVLFVIVLGVTLLSWKRGGHQLQ